MEQANDDNLELGRTVLVVDDDPAILAVLEEALGEEGYRVRTAADGMATLGEMHRDVPDLVITDVRMPQMDGGQLVKRLREWNVPVIMLTADLNRSRTPGVVFVPKPFDLDRLLAIVANMLDNSEMFDEPMS